MITGVVIQRVNSNTFHMPTKTCKNGHKFVKTSSCPVCPVCSSEEELLALHGFGPRALRMLQESLAKKGLTFAQK